jgi:hypothetical protein
MKEQELEIILENLWQGEIDINKAHQQISRLFSVVGRSEQLPCDQPDVKKIAAQCAIQNVNNWVAVKDQLPPDESKRYLVVRDGNVEFDKWIFNGKKGFWWDYIGITHWMQIPEPPCC